VEQNATNKTKVIKYCCVLILRLPYCIVCAYLITLVLFTAYFAPHMKQLYLIGSIHETTLTLSEARFTYTNLEYLKEFEKRVQV